MELFNGELKKTKMKRRNDYKNFSDFKNQNYGRYK